MSVSTGAVVGRPTVTAVTLSKTSNILVGERLTATASVDNNGAPGVTTTYQWKRGGNNISGATGQTYLTVQNDAGLALSVTVTARSSNGKEHSLTSANTSAILSGTPAVTAVTLSKSSSVVIGDSITATATVNNNGAPGVAIFYQWRRGSTVISGATGQSYIAEQVDAGLPLSVTVTARSSNGNSDNRTSASTNPVLSGTPAVTAVALSKTSNIAVGDNITASATVNNNGAPGVTLSYQWRSGVTNISGATGQSYIARSNDLGSALSVIVTATSSNGRSGSLLSGRTDPVTGTPVVTAVNLQSNSTTILVGDRVTATAIVNNNGAPGVTTTWQWLRNGAAISGATGQSYTAVEADARHPLSVMATARSTNGSSSSLRSASTSPVSVPPTPVVTSVTMDKTSNISPSDVITATAVVNNNTAPGVTISYQWQRSGSNISGATGRSYTVGTGDMGRTLSVTATARSSNGQSSSRPSAESRPVNILPTPDVYGLGLEPHVWVGKRVTVTPSVRENGAPNVTLHYQWRRGSTNISGATNQSYTATNNDVGFALIVTVTARSSNGTSDSMWISTGIVER